MKNVLIVGATGMVGNLVLEECISHPEIARITVISRRKINLSNPKIVEVIHEDFNNYDSQIPHFRNIDIGFFCIGVYTGQVSDKEFKVITLDYAVSFAKSLLRGSPDSRLCLLSGAGADRSEKSRFPFARYKGMAENAIDAMGFKSWYSLRPGYIYPVTPRQEPNLMYRISRALYPVLRLFGKNASIKSTELAKAMVITGFHGNKDTILENRDIYTQLSEHQF